MRRCEVVEVLGKPMRVQLTGPIGEADRMHLVLFAAWVRYRLAGPCDPYGLTAPRPTW